MFVRLYQQICGELNCRQLPEEFVFEVIERIHGSATIIDDMLDNEAVRKNIPSYYVRHGKPVAAFAALNLMVKAIEQLCGSPIALARLLENIRLMIDAEEADVGLQTRNPKLTPMEWYQNVVSKKISGELLLILNLCTSPDQVSDSRPEDLRLVTEKLGQLIQYCDDRYDVLVNNPFARMREEEGYVLTYSLPLAVYMADNGSDMEQFVGVKIPRAIAGDLIGQVQTHDNVLSVEAFIDREYQDLIRSIQELPIKRAQEIIEIVDLVKTDSYWERDYYEVTA